MKNKSLIITLIFVAMIWPLMAFAAEDLSNQAPLEILTVEKCLELAYQNNQTLKSANKNIEIAKLQVYEAEGGFMPTAKYSIEAIHYSDSQALYGGSQEGTDGTITVTQPLYTGGVMTSQFKINKINLENALEDLRNAKQQVTFNVIQCYYQVWVAEQLFKVAKSSYENMGYHYQQVKNKYQVGDKSKYDLLQAEVQWESQKPQVIKCENQSAYAKLNLATLIGIEKGRQFTTVYDDTQLQLPDKLDISLQATLDESYRNRPDMRKVKNAIKIGKLNTKISTAGYKPSLSIIGLYENVGPNYYGQQGWEPTWNLSVDLSGMVFDGFVTKTKVAEAKENEELANINELKTRDNVQLEVAQVFQTLKESIETIRSTQANINLAKETLRLAQVRFDAGMATTIDIMDSQLTLDKALNDYYEGISQYLIALAKLDMVIGKDK
jgi:outer membrane protein